MAYEEPYKMRINYCSRQDLTTLPQVGPVWVERLINLREGEGSITPQRFSELGIRNTPTLLTMIDFEPWYPCQSSSSETSMSEPEMKHVFEETQHQDLASITVG